jgi:MbtH protein
MLFDLYSLHSAPDGAGWIWKFGAINILLLRSKNPLAMKMIFGQGPLVLINSTEEITEMDETEDKTIYKVVLNHEEQYSIWPADRENAPGWNDAGKTGTKAECLEYIKEVWTDMRPLSLRQKMAAAGQA